MKKYRLIVPIAGLGSRMIAGGFKLPKPMLMCGDKTILEWSMSSIDTSECDIEFIVSKKHVDEFSIDNWLRNLYKDCKIIILDKQTNGACETVYKAIDSIEQRPLIIYCPDTTFTPIFKPNDKYFDCGGHILTFKANSKNYSYIKTKASYVEETAEKEVISNNASVGVYCFETDRQFCNYAHDYINNCVNKECHICPVYNLIIRSIATNAQTYDIRNRTWTTYRGIGWSEVEKIHIMGTPEEFHFFENVSYKYLIPNRKFYICSDHSGYDIKEKIIEYTKSQDIEIFDIGCFSRKDCDYNVYVKAVADIIKNKPNAFGIGVCRSGQGINICANKISGIRACLIQDEYHAEFAIRHNAGNFFSLSGKDMTDENIKNIICNLNTATFDGGRHQCRLMQNEG